MKKDEYGVYEIFLPNKADGTPAIEHNSKVKVRRRKKKKEKKMAGNDRTDL